MISDAGLCWQHVGGVGSTTTTTTDHTALKVRSSKLGRVGIGRSSVEWINMGCAT